MGKKIFVSYKYKDSNVQRIPSILETTVRNYVDVLERKLEAEDNIYKGEEDGEDLSKLSDEEIWNKLKDRIYDSSITLIMISPGMKEPKPERAQWIPWEISYSLKEVSRTSKNGESITSRSNALVAVVLPDSTGSYSYYFEPRTCCERKCIIQHKDILFPILQQNIFNRKKNDSYTCNQNCSIWTGAHSYMVCVKWEDFFNNPTVFIKSACERQDEIENYTICKEVSNS